MDVRAAEERGELAFMTDRDPFLKDGSEFDPDHLLDTIQGLFGQTVEAGYAGLRLTADVPWLTRDVPGVPLLAICQYRLGELEPEDALGILERHPLTLVGGRVHVNERYAVR